MANARVIHQDVEPRLCCGYLLHSPLVGHIHLHGLRTGQFFRQLLRRLQVQVGDDDRRTGTREFTARRGTNAAGTAGHQRNLAAE